MFNSLSIKNRLIISLLSNAVRSVIGFFSGLLIARGLNPSGYGDMMFLLASFTAIRSLFDMGSSNAFYTFISQRRRSRHFYLIYLGWLVLQFVIPALMVAVVMPTTMIAKVWLGHSRAIILLAFAASFMQQQVWQTFNQIGEASRKTVRVQIINMALGIGHLIIVTFLLAFNSLSVVMILWVFIGEYLLSTLLGSLYIREHDTAVNGNVVDDISFKQYLLKYWHYCKPLVALSWLGFLYEFLDRWLLQRFGGPDQQGFYQIAYQFSAISLIATSSIMNVFWKEIAEAHERKDAALVAAIYHKVNKGLVIFGAFISGLLMPWTNHIIDIFLGNAYTMATPVLLITFLYPIHQSMGQVGTTMLLASGQTHKYMVMTVISTLASFPISYLVLAPSSGGVLIPGLGLGAIGMALKLVLLNAASVNVQAWVIARHGGWKYDWTYQVVGIGSAVLLGYTSKRIINLIWIVQEHDRLALLVTFLTTGILYAFAMATLVYVFPWLIGMNRTEIKALLGKLHFSAG